MRTIKFRGKSLTTEEWLYGSHFNDGAKDYILPNLPSGAIDYESYQVDQNTIGQFTGLLDKNGKEIYEGDILSGKHWKKIVVKWISEDARFTLIYSEDNYGMSINQSWLIRDEIQVIGNIHDNPELIKD